MAPRPVASVSLRPRASLAHGFIVALLAIAAPALLLAVPACAWDAGTHRLITRLAVGALAPSPLADFLGQNERHLERFSVEPDTVLKNYYGKAETRRHFIDLEDYGPDPFAKLEPDENVMVQRFGRRKLDESGTLPWTIERRAGEMQAAWRKHDCAEVIRSAGYLSHYVADASQPLHTTIYYDGYRSDRGLHARFEFSAEQADTAVEESARRQVRIEPVKSVWETALAEIKQSHRLVTQVIDSERAARRAGPPLGPAYEEALMRADGAMIAAQVARAASTLASIWLFEWQQAGRPTSCSGRLSIPHGVPPAGAW